MTETVTEQRRGRRPRWWQRLIEDCRRILDEIKEDNLSIIRKKHRLGRRTLEDEENYRGWQARGSGEYIQNLAEELRVSTSTLYHAIRFARKFPDLESFLRELSIQIESPDQLTWTYVYQNLLYEPRETETMEGGAPLTAVGSTNEISEDIPIMTPRPFQHVERQIFHPVRNVTVEKRKNELRVVPIEQECEFIPLAEKRWRPDPSKCERCRARDRCILCQE